MNPIFQFSTLSSVRVRKRKVRGDYTVKLIFFRASMYIKCYEYISKLMKFLSEI